MTGIGGDPPPAFTHMTNERFELSRRKALAALGTIGVASAGAGLGTSAYFSDQETFENNQLAAGTLDMKVDWEEHYYDGSAGSDLVQTDDPDGSGGTGPIVDLPTGSVTDPAAQSITLYPSSSATKDQFWDATSVEALPDSDNDGVQDPVQDPCGSGSNLVDVGADDGGLDSGNRTDSSRGDPLIDLQDVKPGDFGEVTFSTHLCTNPGYIWMNAFNVSQSGGSQTEPELDDPDNTSGGDLLDQVQARIWYDDDCDNQRDGNETVVLGPDSLNNVLSTLQSGNGFALDGSRAYVGPHTGEYDDFVRLGVNHLDLTDDGNSDVVFTEATDPAGSETVVYGNSGGSASGDYATTVASLSDVTLGDIAGGATLTYDYYEGGGHTHAAPDEVWLLLEQPDGTRTTVRRTSNDDNPAPGSPSRSAGNWYTRTIHNEILGDPDYNQGYNWFEAGGKVNPNVGTEDLTAEYSTDTKILRVGIGLGSTGGATSDVYYRNLSYDGEEIDIPTPNSTRDCFAGQTTHCFGFQWWVPLDHGNEIQGDTASFDLGFYTEQCRHNDGSGMNNEDVSSGTPQSVSLDASASDSFIDAGIAVGSDDDGNSLNDIVFDFPDPGPIDISNVDQGDVTPITLNGSDISSDFGSASGSNNGTTLTLGFGGSTSLNTGDSIDVGLNDVGFTGSGPVNVDVSVNGGETTTVSMSF